MSKLLNSFSAKKQLNLFLKTLTSILINLTTLITVAILFFSFLNLKSFAGPATTQPNIIINKLFDGTMPFDLNDTAGNDSSGTNNRVRAGQVVSYKFDLSLNDPLASSPTPYDNIQFVTTPLTLGYLWDVVPLTCSGAGSQITGDGITTQSVLTCNTGTKNTGDAWSIAANVRALPSLTDGSTYHFDATVTASGTTNTDNDNSPLITGASLPKIDLQKSGAVFFGSKGIAGVPGFIYEHGLGLKLKAGSEVPALPLTLTDDDNDSDANITNVQTEIIVLTSGENDASIYADLVVPVKFGNLVWEDKNGNGIQEEGENGINDVEVSLKDSFGNPVYDINGNLLTSVLTDTNGNYQFTNLLPGSYYIEVTLPGNGVATKYEQGTDTALDSNYNPATNRSNTFTITSGNEDQTIDVGIIFPSTIGDTVWIDTNADGIKNLGENGIDGITVTLVDLNTNPVTDLNGNVVASQITNENGNYLFENLAPGDYVVKFYKPANYINSNFSCVTATTINTYSTANGLGTEICSSNTVNVSSGQDIETIDLGLYNPASVGDKVWEDKNGNGIQEEGENGISGVQVSITDINGNPITDIFGTTVSSTTTASTGTYLFENLKPGEYIVTFTNSGGTVFTTPLNGSNTNLDSNANIATGKTESFVLVSGQEVTNIDAGLFTPVKIGDQVWNDKNRNGIKDSNDNGIAGIQVIITDSEGGPVTDTSGNTVLPQTTDSNGNYQFINLTPGDYVITFVKPSGVINTIYNTEDQNTNSDAIVSTSQTNVISTVSGDNITNIDAGFIYSTSIGNKVWLDQNGNGIQDNDETAIAGVLVKLTDVNGNSVVDLYGNPVLDTVSNTSGEYLFSNLAPGNYIVEFVRPEELYFTKKVIDTNLQTSVVNIATGKTDTINLESEQNNTNQDAGLVQAGSLGSYVWIDANGNGLQDEGELPIEGIKVTLLNENFFPVYDVNGNLVTELFTDANGLYLFTNLAPGNYRVQFERPDSYFITTQGTGLNNDSDVRSNDIFATTSVTETVTVSSGKNKRHVDAGYRRIGNDLDNDGYLDEEEILNGTDQFSFTLTPINLGINDPYICGANEFFGAVTYNRSYSLVSVSTTLRRGNTVITVIGKINDGQGNFTIPVDYNTIQSGIYEVTTLATDIYGNEATFRFQADVKPEQNCAVILDTVRSGAMKNPILVSILFGNIAALLYISISNLQKRYK